MIGKFEKEDGKFEEILYYPKAYWREKGFAAKLGAIYGDVGAVLSE